MSQATRGSAQPGQRTLAQSFSVAGVGLHTGLRSRVTVSPAPTNHGIVFRVADGGASTSVPVRWTGRLSSPLCTALDLGDGRKLRTVEHLIASLAAFEIDNALVEIDAPEVPIFDGSARVWCERLAEVGTRSETVPRRAIRLLRPFQVTQGNRFIRVEPSDRLAIDVTFDRFPAYGVLRWRGEVTRDVFVRDLSNSRSFGQLQQVWERGRLKGTVFARLGPLLNFEPLLQRMLSRRPVVAKRRSWGGNEPHQPSPADESPLTPAIYAELEDEKRRFAGRDPVLRGLRPGRVAVVVGASILGGSRYPDEPVRHVVLDLIGDMTLTGAPLLGHVTAHAPTHETTYVFARALMSTPEAWTWA